MSLGLCTAQLYATYKWIESHSTTPAAIKNCPVFLCCISTFLVQLEPGVPPRGSDHLCLEYEVMNDSSDGLDGICCTVKWRRDGLLLCGQDHFTRGNADACLPFGNSLSGETPGIPKPPKGGHPGDLGGTHSLQSKHREEQGGCEWWKGVLCSSVEH